jgi:hypothetical protein
MSLFAQTDLYTGAQGYFELTAGKNKKTPFEYYFERRRCHFADTSLYLVDKCNKIFLLWQGLLGAYYMEDYPILTP